MEIVQNQLESVARLQSSLSAAGIQSVVIGGIAVAVWGDPRVTKDADLKVLLTREQAKQLLDAIPSEYQIISNDPEGDLRQLGFIFIKDSSGVRISTRAYDHEDARKVIARQARKLDHEYIEDWLREFETALDDSTLVQSYRKMITA